MSDILVNLEFILNKCFIIYLKTISLLFKKKTLNVSMEKKTGSIFISKILF